MTFNVKIIHVFPCLYLYSYWIMMIYLETRIIFPKLEVVWLLVETVNLTKPRVTWDTDLGSSTGILLLVFIVGRSTYCAQYLFLAGILDCMSGEWQMSSFLSVKTMSSAVSSWDFPSMIDCPPWAVSHNKFFPLK